MHNRCQPRCIFIFIFFLKIFFKMIFPIQEDCFFYVEGSDVMTLGACVILTYLLGSWGGLFLVV